MVSNAPAQTKMSFDQRRNTVKFERSDEVVWVTRREADYLWRSNKGKRGHGNVRQLHDGIEYTEAEWEFFDSHI